MIDDPVGWMHFGLAGAALALGFGVVARRKGDRLHRTVGHLYVSAMLGVNLTALAIYDLFGSFGPFHWAAVVSLATIVAGMVPVVARRPRDGWYEMHAKFMAWSYVGLVAAAVAEAATRTPWIPLGPGVLLGMLVVFPIGAWLIEKNVGGRAPASPG